jgi:hypothetical protein
LRVLPPDCLFGARHLELGKDDGDLEGKHNRMTTRRAALHVASAPAPGANGRVPDIAQDPDPLRRLEAELQRASGERSRSDGERLHEEAWSLLEEAWGLVTECLVLRDGLLDACHEIEQTMDGIQRRLEGLPGAGQSGAREHLATGEQSTVSASGDAPATR